MFVFVSFLFGLKLISDFSEHKNSLNIPINSFIPAILAIG
jgi:hypothetical protein